MSGNLHDPFEDDGDRGRDDDCAPVDDAAVQELCRLALIELDGGHAERARELAAEAIEVDAEHPYPLFVLGVCAEAEGDLAAAGYLSERALRLASSNADLIQFRAQVLLRDGETRDALKLLRYGVAMHPSDADLHAQLARTLLACGEAEPAQQAALASVRLDATNAAAREVLHATGTERGADEELLAAMRQAALMHPDDAYMQVDLAAAELNAGNTDAAQRLMLRAQRLAPTDRAITAARRMLVEAYGTRSYAGIPRLRRWLESFPGGQAGFVVTGFLLGIPLVALARADAAVVPAVAAVLVGWFVLAAYLWLAPKAADVRYSQAIAREATRATPSTVDSVLDVVVVNFAAGNLRAAHAAAANALTRGVFSGRRDHDAIAAMHPVRHRFRRLAVGSPVVADVLLPCALAMTAAAVVLSVWLPTVAIACGAAGAVAAVAGWWMRRSRETVLRAVRTLSIRP